LRLLNCLSPIGCLAADLPRIFLFQCLTQGLANDWAVVRDKDALSQKNPSRPDKTPDFLLAVESAFGNTVDYPSKARFVLYAPNT
jgi:hypothetical protein